MAVTIRSNWDELTPEQQAKLRKTFAKLTVPEFLKWEAEQQKGAAESAKEVKGWEINWEP